MQTVTNFEIDERPLVPAFWENCATASYSVSARGDARGTHSGRVDNRRGFGGTRDGAYGRACVHERGFFVIVEMGRNFEDSGGDRRDRGQFVVGHLGVDGVRAPSAAESADRIARKLAGPSFVPFLFDVS